MEFLPKNIRNVAVLGHSGSGKTSLVESLCYISKSIEKKGSIETKNTVSDFLAIEKEKFSSFRSSLVPIVFKNNKINFIDIPGNDDFIYEAFGVTKVVKGAILVIDATRGIEVETRKHWKLLRKRHIPTIIYINKMDKEEVDFLQILSDIRSEFGKASVPFTYPTGKERNFDGFVNTVDLVAKKYNGIECVTEDIFDDKKMKIFNCHQMIVEAVAETSDTLLEKFFDGEEITKKEIHKGLRKGVLDGNIIPVVVGSATKNIGSETMLNMLIEYLANPVDLKNVEGNDISGKKVYRKTDNKEPFSAQVFKTVVDPFVGTVSYFKVYSGSLGVGDTVYCFETKTTEKINSLFTMFGDKVVYIDRVYSGDIACTTKLSNVANGYSLSDPKAVIKFSEIKYPSAVLFKALTVDNKKDDDKLGVVLKKIMLEDPTVSLKRNRETSQLLIGTGGETHLAYILDHIKRDYKIQLTVSEPLIVYRETIKKEGRAIGRYIKQSGGSGHYGVVDMSFTPSEENIFEEKVYGGAVPRNYFLAVEKGMYEAFENGLLAGFPVINVKGVLLDGKYHPVDSDDLAFRNAAKEAFKACYLDCSPTILEPILRVVINVSNEYIGDVLSDISTRRARIETMRDKGDNITSISCLVPESMLSDYCTSLKALTQGSGYFTRTFVKYEEVPNVLIDKIISERKV